MSILDQEGIPFPWRLHGMLDAAERDGFAHIVSWQLDGCGFKVHKPQAFTSHVMPRYLSTMTKYKSFIRQVNLYSFQRVTEGPNRGVYSHPNFLKTFKQLCCTMTRQQRKVAPSARPSSTASKEEEKKKVGDGQMENMRQSCNNTGRTKRDTIFAFTGANVDRSSQDNFPFINNECDVNIVPRNQQQEK